MPCLLLYRLKILLPPRWSRHPDGRRVFYLLCLVVPERAVKSRAIRKVERDPERLGRQVQRIDVNVRFGELLPD